ncbi:MAG: response regulator [Bdellovibrionales bacterium]|nr:response regulator [Bdellovibrionales bacterium]
MLIQENRNLLIVDDEPEALEGYRQFLAPPDRPGPRSSSRREGSAAAATPHERETYTLFLASSGKEALQIFQRELGKGNEIAAGFFDVKLGGDMDGLQTIQAIKALSPDLHCVVVTAYQDRGVDEIQELFGEEFKDHWDFLNKPFSQGEIVQKARQMVAAWNRRRQLSIMQKQLVQAERLSAVGQVARGVGHEFGNLLQRIVGKVDLALVAHADPAKVKDHLETALKACERAGTMARNLQSFARNDMTRRPCSIASGAEDALTLMHHDLNKGSVTVVRDFREAPEVNADPSALGQIFLNLLINALHAMPQGGKLTVTVSAADGGPDKKPGVACVVEDTGTGIPKDVLDRIFDYAFTTKGEKGSGLGLSISRGIAEEHGGTLTVASQPGRGAAFTLWLPSAGNP